MAECAFMIRKVILCSIVVLMSVSASAFYQAKAEKEFVGAINNTMKIRIRLAENNGKYQGTYLYEKVGKDLRLNGASRGEGEFYLNEFDESGKKTGVFEGHFVSEDWIEGTWVPGAGKKSVAFSAWNPKGKDVPTDSKDDKVSGEYKRVDEQGRFDSNTAVLNVWLLKSGRVRVAGDATWVADPKKGNVNVGEVDGVFDLKSNKVVYGGSDADDPCRFTITIGAGSLAVTEDNLQCGGLNVSFDGTYRKVGPPKPE